MAVRARARSRVKLLSRRENPYREVDDHEYPYRYAVARDSQFWAMKSWCKNQFGAEYSSWRTYDLKPRVGGDLELEYWFRDQGDCMMFRLMWGKM